jgi:uncharacterized protein (TIGR02145 family)
MKKLFTILASILTVGLFAQIPQKMNYQAVVRDASGKLVTNHLIGIRVSILQGSASGAAVYIETQTPTSNANGLVTIEIGTGLTSDNFSAINWANGPYFIEAETDPTGGSSYTISGTSQLLSVPYALYAKTAENGFSGNYNDLTNKPTLFDGNYNSLSNKLAVADSINKYAVLLKDNQTIAGNKIFTGKVSVNAPTVSTDAVNKAYVDGLKQQIKLLEDNLIAAGTYKLADIDGNQYNVVKIGKQLWMKENLRTRRYNDGTPIPKVPDYNNWPDAYYWYNNDSVTYNIYGPLYNFYVIENDHNVCPAGWHVPSKQEWITLKIYLGSDTLVGGKMKEVGTTHWLVPNTSATNESGFSAIPGGLGYDGYFQYIGMYACWWSSSIDSYEKSYYEMLSYKSSRFIEHSGYNEFGYSIRCLRDN